MSSFPAGTKEIRKGEEREGRGEANHQGRIFRKKRDLRDQRIRSNNLLLCSTSSRCRPRYRTQRHYLEDASPATRSCSESPKSRNEGKIEREKPRWRR